MVKPSVSVLMPVYNAGPFVEESMMSALSQALRDLELIVVDDGSTDNSLAVIQRVASRDSRVRVVSRPNRGVFHTRNELLDLASADLVAVLDADDIALPERLEIEKRYLDEHPECVAVGSRAKLIDPEGVVICEHFLLTTHEQIDASHMSGTGWSAMSHSSIMMRKDVALAAGGYRDGFTGADDFELWLRLAERGKLANLPQVLVLYRMHEASMSHQKGREMEEGTRRAVNAARLRRGMPTLPEVSPSTHPHDSGHKSPGSHPRYDWMLRALSAGNYSAAWHMVRKVWSAAPFSPLALRMAVMTALWPILPTFFRLRDSIRGPARAE